MGSTEQTVIALQAEIERLRTLLNAARKHIDHKEQPYLSREISLALDFNSNLSG